MLNKVFSLKVPGITIIIMIKTEEFKKHSINTPVSIISISFGLNRPIEL